jgi:hypothetical protein
MLFGLLLAAHARLLQPASHRYVLENALSELEKLRNASTSMELLGTEFIVQQANLTASITNGRTAMQDTLQLVDDLGWSVPGPQAVVSAQRSWNAMLDVQAHIDGISMRKLQDVEMTMEVSARNALFDVQRVTAAVARAETGESKLDTALSGAGINPDAEVTAPGLPIEMEHTEAEAAATGTATGEKEAYDEGLTAEETANAERTQHAGGTTALAFNHKTDFLDVTDPIGAVPNTFMVWVLVAFGVDGRLHLAGNYPEKPSINWEIHDEGRPRIYWNNGERDIIFNDDVRTALWEHLCFVRDPHSGKIRYFRNGNLIEEVEGAGSDVTLGPILIGRDKRGDTSPYFRGAISMPRIFETALTVDSIKGEMASSCCSASAVLSLDFYGGKVTDCNGRAVAVHGTKGLAPPGPSIATCDYHSSEATPSAGDAQRAEAVEMARTSHAVSTSALAFNHPTDFLEIPKPLGGVPNTFMVWVLVAFGVDGRLHLAGNYPDKPSINWEIHDEGRPRIYWNNGERDIIFNDDIRTNQWEHLCFVRDVASGKLRYYRGGELKQEVDGAGTDVQMPGGLLISKDKRGETSPYFRGGMAMVRIFERALSQADVQAEMASTCCPDSALLSLQFVGGEVSECSGQVVIVHGAQGLAPRGPAAASCAAQAAVQTDDSEPAASPHLLHVLLYDSLGQLDSVAKQSDNVAAMEQSLQISLRQLDASLQTAVAHTQYALERLGTPEATKALGRAWADLHAVAARVEAIDVRSMKETEAAMEVAASRALYGAQRSAAKLSAQRRDSAQMDGVVNRARAFDKLPPMPQSTPTKGTGVSPPSTLHEVADEAATVGSSETAVASSPTSKVVEKAATVASPAKETGATAGPSVSADPIQKRRHLRSVAEQLFHPRREVGI